MIAGDVQPVEVRIGQLEDAAETPLHELPLLPVTVQDVAPAIFHEIVDVAFFFTRFGFALSAPVREPDAMSAIWGHKHPGAPFEQNCGEPQVVVA